MQAGFYPREMRMNKGKNGVPRGRPKSGRIWREPGEKSRNIVAVNSALRQPWKKRLQDRAEKTAMKQLEQELREEAQKERVERRKRLEEKKQRKIENQKKGEVVQKITNVKKLKRLKKKQLRNIEKR